MNMIRPDASRYDFNDPIEGVRFAKDAMDYMDQLESNTYSYNEVDIAYMLGILNTSGIEVFRSELNRLFKLDKKPHEIILSLRSE